MDKVTKSDLEVFANVEEWFEILVDLVNGDYTVEALRQDYKWTLENND
jgi:hypothetical protein